MQANPLRLFPSRIFPKNLSNNGLRKCFFSRFASRVEPGIERIKKKKKKKDKKKKSEKSEKKEEL